MRNLLLLSVLSLAFVGCGDDHHSHITQVTEVVQSQEFEGRYDLPNGGFLELLADGEDQVTFLAEDQRILLLNPENKTLGTFPKIFDENVNIIGDTFIIARDFNFTSANDLEEDASGDNITGWHYAVITGFIREDGRLQINFKVYSGMLASNPNFLILNRTIVSNIQ